MNNRVFASEGTLEAAWAQLSPPGAWLLLECFWDRELTTLFVASVHGSLF